MSTLLPSRVVPFSRVMLPRLILLNGPSGSGKTTLAKMLVERHDALLYSLAAPLKDALTCLAFGAEFLETDYDDQGFKNLPLPGTTPLPERTTTIRSALVDLGLLARTWSPSFLSFHLARDLEKNSDFAPVHVVTDVRLPGDLTHLPASGVLVQLSREGCSFARDGFGQYVEPCGATRRIVNPGDSLEGFYTSAIAALEIKNELLHVLR